jgi:uncharacterized alkaline shock family protein YloU
MTRRKSDPANLAESKTAPAAEAGADVGRKGAVSKSAKAAAAAVLKQKKGQRGSRRAPRPSGEVDRITVVDDALATVVGHAAHEVPGVVGMAPASFSEGLRRVLGLSQVDEGVEVERESESNRVRLVLHVVVAYGVNIPAVAESVAERVRYAAKTFAGVEVSDLKVHVAGVSRG